MTSDPAALDYLNVLKKAFAVATRPENIFVLLFGAAVVFLGSCFSAFLLAGPLGVGYAHACSKMVQGKRVEFDDIFWRGFERWWSAIPAGIILGLATFVLSIILVPAYFSLLFSAVVYCTIALTPEPISGFRAIDKVWRIVRANPAPMAIMGLIFAVISGVLTLTVVGIVLVVALGFLIAVFIHAQYLRD
ncbi:MAG: hypothetical protein KTR25_11160 [Myxococcales bacterium]|nr:hypothetical protein [Myxococcales bacterium]